MFRTATLPCNRNAHRRVTIDVEISQICGKCVAMCRNRFSPPLPRLLPPFVNFVHIYVRKIAQIHVATWPGRRVQTRSQHRGQEEGECVLRTRVKNPKRDGGRASSWLSDSKTAANHVTVEEEAVESATRLRGEITRERVGFAIEFNGTATARDRHRQSPIYLSSRARANLHFSAS